VAEQSIEGYRLGKLEETVAELVQEVRGLPDKLDARYALKAEVQAVDSKVEEDREAAKTKRTGVRSLYVGLAVAGFGVFAAAFVSFMVWVVQNIEHVQNLGSS
jgi:tetrahydromethanopterin S-methyltransferase subunit F